MSHYRAHGVRILLSLALLGAIGCGVGEDRVLFVTLTGIMINADSQPPALDIGYGRQEGVYSPAFQKGQLPPVLASVRSNSQTLGLVVDQSYATGDAALMMAKEFNLTDNPCVPGGSDPLCPPVSSDRAIHATPAPTNLWDDFLSFFAVGGSDRHPYFFGTDTSIGLHVAWGTTTVPRAVSIGYKRKELAILPLIETPASAAAGATCAIAADNSLKQVCVKLPSVIATSATNAQVTTQAAGTSGLQANQTFATGDAATYLASDPDIRKVLGPQVVGQDIAAFKKGVASQADLYSSIKATWNNGQHHTPAEVQAEANTLFAPSGPPFQNFPKDLALFVDGSSGSTTKLQKLQDYIAGK